MEVVSARDLGADCGGVAVHRGVREQADGRGHGRVDDGPDGRPLGPQVLDQGGERFAVRHVAGGDRHTDALCLEFGPQFGGARRGLAASAGEDDVFGAVVGEPVCEVAAEGSGSPDDQDGAARFPGAWRGRAAEGGPDEAAYEDAGGADGQLVLRLVTGECGAQVFQ